MSYNIYPNHGGSYIDSFDWIKDKKVTINTVNEKDNKCFQYTVTVAASYSETEKKKAQWIRKIKPFISKYKWEIINFPSQQVD